MLYIYIIYVNTWQKVDESETMFDSTCPNIIPEASAISESAIMNIVMEIVEVKICKNMFS